jgi:cytoskeletal protein CcmA (bactofilin family)
LFKSDLTVNKDSELVGQTVLGQVSEIDPALTPNAQLYIADTRYKEALRIDSRDYANLVFRQGKLAIGKNDPRVALDVVGELNVSQNAEIEGELEVEGELKARDNMEVFGSMHVSQKANFGSDVRVRGDLIVEDKTNIEEELYVTGRTQLQADLEVKLNTTLEGTLDVAGEATFLQGMSVAGPLSVSDHLKIEKDLHLNGALHTGVANPQGHFHMESPAQKNAFVLDQARGDESSQRLLTLDKDGQLGLGTDAPTQTLDVLGGATISGQLHADSGQFNGAIHASNISSGSLNVSAGLQLASGPVISAISDDQMLGSDASLNSVLPTQAAVKAYIDNVAVPFGRGGKTFTVSSQRDFDALFNLSNSTSISENTTVILLPFSNQGVSEYQLKNTVSLRSGVSIFGFNEQTTRIAKQNPNARFEIIGRSHERIKHVQLTGFTFDGKNLECSRDGAAFYLEHASDLKLNCRIENHTTWGDGGAIFAPVSEAGQYCVSQVEALHVYNCRALDQGSGSDTQLNEGGAAYGLYRSTIHAFECQAERGGAVAKCKECQVQAHDCRASRSGGAAYRCELLRLTATDCVANMQNGKGGAAYYCSDLVCEGIWTGNNAAEAPHIYASNHQTGASEERHYWKGDYVGRRIDDDSSVWRVHNE